MFAAMICLLFTATSFSTEAEQAKSKGIEEGYELTSYSSTHKVKKDDDYFIVKTIKQW